MNEERQRIAFFCRAKPQGVDALDVFLENRGVYIGYPFVKKGKRYDPHNLATCLVDFTCHEDEWAKELNGQAHQQSKNRNRNFIPRVTRGSYVVIPRPSDARIYVGQIASDFHIVNDPKNTDSYLQRCKEQIKGSSEEQNMHRADVAMGWAVDEYRSFDLSRLPCWLRMSLQGRSTYGVFKDHPLDEDYTAVTFFDDLVQGNDFKPWHWTSELEQIKRRLVETLTVNSFEHLVVSLLQLEFPEERWVQTGGAGDGGIDGLGSDQDGKVTGIMQAKLYAHDVPELGGIKPDGRGIRRYAAVLLLKNRPKEYTHNLLDIEWIATKFREHAERLPLALTMRVQTA